MGNRGLGMKRAGIILLTILILMHGAAWASEFFDATLGDFTEELKTAQEQGKKGIMLFFEEDTCPFCDWMEEKIFADAEVNGFYKKHFLIFSVDIRGDVEITDFKGGTMTEKKYARSNLVRATPTFIFFDLKGNEVARYIGAAQNAAEFLWLGEYVANDVYMEMPFLKYKQQKQKEKSK
jgi:thioredoxin-related protein